jgi:hypothetical protein
VSVDYQILLEVARAHIEPGSTAPLPHDSVLDLLSARISLLPEKVPAKNPQRPADQVEGLAIRYRDSALPRSWIVHRVDVLGALGSHAPSQIRRRTEDVLFPSGQPRDWRQVAVIETDLPLPLPLPKGEVSEQARMPANQALEPAPKETCELVYADPLRVEIVAHLASTGLVVLSDLYFPGWELTVETGGASQAAPIWRTNRLMRGAVLPAGDHRLVYRYRPRSVFYGGAISLLAAMSLVVGAVVARRRLAKQTRQNPPAAQI